MNLKTLVSEARKLGSLPGGNTHEHADWLIGPVGQHRDSDTIEESNFRVAIARFKAIDPDENDHEIHRFGHFAVGWVEEIATRPGSLCAKLADDMRESLDVYPILSDDDHSALEQEYITENLSAIMSELRSDLRKEFTKRHEQNPEDDDMSEDEISDALDEISDDDLDLHSHDHVREIVECWPRFDVEAVADALLAKGLL